MAALTLDNGIFRAEIIPEIGGNVISLRHQPSGTKLLREPADLRELERFPEQFGLPVLFPPNRIEDGKFTFEGRLCRLPVNEKAMHNHLHGLVVNKPWNLVFITGHSAELTCDFNSSNPEYEGFPFAFTLKREVVLTETGLQDRMTVTNRGKWDMPLGLGYHSTFPADPAQIRLSAGPLQFEIGERYLPTGRLLEWGEIDPRKWFDPSGINAGFHMRAESVIAEDGSRFHGAEIRYESGLLRYITDEKFGFWYTWNKRGLGDFISLEPVSWMANALNQPGPPEETGVRALAPSSEITFLNELRFAAEP